MCVRNGVRVHPLILIEDSSSRSVLSSAARMDICMPQYSMHCYIDNLELFGIIRTDTYIYLASKIARNSTRGTYRLKRYSLFCHDHNQR